MLRKMLAFAVFIPVTLLVSPMHAQIYAAPIQVPVGQGPQALAALDTGTSTLMNLAVGCPSINTVYIYTPTVQGGVTVYTLLATVVPPTGTPGFVPGEFGYSILSIIDVDGDLTSDFLVGAPGSTPQGAVYLVSGATFQLLQTLQPKSGLTSPCTGSSRRFGQSLASFITTTNNHVAIGAPEFRRTANCAQLDGLVEMWRMALPMSYTSFIKSSHGGDELGSSITQVVDTDDTTDTLPDLIIGAAGGNRAYLYSGSTVLGINPLPAATFIGQPGEHLGYMVAECPVAMARYTVLGAPFLESICNGNTSQMYALPSVNAVALSTNPALWNIAFNPIAQLQDIAVSCAVGGAAGLSSYNHDLIVGAPKLNTATCGQAQLIVYDGNATPPFSSASTLNFAFASNLLGTSVIYLGPQASTTSLWYAVADPGAVGGGCVWTFF
jgi:hypothetical protein